MPTTRPPAGLLTFLEDFVREEVLPRYANSHTVSSGTGLQTTRLREDSRAIIRDAVGGDEETVVIFAGSGATGAIDKLIGILGLRIPCNLEDASRLRRHQARLGPCELQLLHLRGLHRRSSTTRRRTISSACHRSGVGLQDLPI
jgi:hypothetical protein